MLTRLYADNFRCLVNFELKLGPKNVLMGNNGSGKSATLQTLAHLRRLILGEGQVRDVFNKPSLTRWDRRSVQSFELDAALPDGDYSYKMAVEHSASGDLCRA